MTAHAQEAGGGSPHLLAVQVNYQEAGQEPYWAEVAPEITVGAVLLQALEHFDVWHTEVEIFVLTHDGHRESEDRTIGQIVGNEDSTIRFQLDYMVV